jgi:hypothetical protein
MDYTALSGKVKEVLAELGAPVTVKRVGSIVGTGSAVFVSSTTKDMKSIAANTASTEKSLYFAGSCTPMVGDTVESSLGNYKVLEKDEVNPAGTALVFLLKVRS